MSIISQEQLRQIMPLSDGPRLAAFAAPLAEAMVEFGIDTPARQAAFLAQIAHESGGLRYLEEKLNYSADRLRAVFPRHFSTQEAIVYARQPSRIASRAYAGRLGNGDEESGDGWTYRGRGLIQITGRDNYRACSLALGVDLLAEPDRLLEPVLAARSAAWFWQERGLNRYADAGDFTAITLKINGGLNGQPDRLAYWGRAKEVLA